MYWLINSHNYCNNIERSLLSLVPFTDWYCSFSCGQFFAIPWTAPHQASLSFIISWNLLKFMFIEPMMLSNHLPLCHILLLLLSVFPSIEVFSNESVLGGQSMGVSASVSVLPSYSYFVHKEARAKRFSDLPIFHD